MAEEDKSLVRRSVARVLRIFNVLQSKEISNTPTKLPEVNVNYGLFNEHELRYLTNDSKQNKSKKPEDIMSYLASVSNNSRRIIEDIKNLKVIAPEIKQARQMIISSIISPNDMQTSLVSVSSNYIGLSEDINGKISTVLNDHFNEEYKLAPKLVSWLGTAGFEEGSKSILVLPRCNNRVLNEIADTWYPGDLDIATESLFSTTSIEADIDSEVMNIAIESILDEHGMESMDAPTKTRLVSDLSKNNLKLLKENKDCITVTRDISIFSKTQALTDKRATKLAKQAAKQLDGFVPNSEEQPGFNVFTVDSMNPEKGDMPVVIEWPADAVIPVCAPGSVENHIGYFLLIDANGQPAKGEMALNGGFGMGSSKIAYSAAKSVYGTSVMHTFDQSQMTPEQQIETTTHVFNVAINKILKSKLSEDGIQGVDISIHNAVGKSIFFNLLAKNKIKLVFVPEPMMVYYRFLHRSDGTGMTFLEDISFILALRTTLTIAKVMAGVDNATKHRTIEVNVDEMNKNPLETLELVRREYLNKHAPTFTNDPSAAAESILNQHLTITPKSIAGSTEDLSINVDSKYGNSQAPDSDIMDTLNNWMGLGLYLPPTALNQLAETEFSRSIVVSNLWFSNNVRTWQNDIQPYNNKFVKNYVGCHRGLLDKIRKILRAQGKGTHKSTSSNISGSVDTKHDNNIEVLLQRVIASIEVVLPTPNVATSKAHHEEIQAYMDSVSGMIERIFPDDMAAGDSDAQTYLASLRAVITGNILREFMNKIGFHELASIPTTDDVVMDQVKETMQFLLNAKRRIENSAKLHKGEIGSDSSSDSSF